ncbi:hypothetical protein Ciccas_011805, partial [Cichlidogyrus casuarinus]
ALAECALKPFVFVAPKTGKRHQFGANFLEAVSGSGKENGARSSSLGVAGPPGAMPLYVALSTLGASFGMMSLQKLMIAKPPMPSGTGKNKTKKRPVLGPISAPIQCNNHYSTSSSDDRAPQTTPPPTAPTATEPLPIQPDCSSGASISSKQLHPQHGPPLKKTSPTRLSLSTLKKLNVFHSADASTLGISEDALAAPMMKKASFMSSQSDATASCVNSAHPLLQSRLSTSGGDQANPKLQLVHSSSEFTESMCQKNPVLVSCSMPLHKCPRSTVSPFVPFVVELCVTLTERFGLNCVGIYRMSGAKIAQDFIASQLTKSVNEIDVQSEKWNDINAVSGVLKTFLRNLPDSLFPRQMYPEFMAACKIEDRERKLLSIQRLLGIMECYPDHSEFRVHRATLRYLITHLARVAARQNVNRMTPYNLALVFAPNLLQPDVDTPEILMADSKFKIWLVETLIKYHDWIFSPDLGLESGCTVPPDSSQDASDDEPPVDESAAVGRQEGDVRPVVADLLQAAANLPPPLDDLETAEEPGPDTDRPADLEAARLLREQRERQLHAQLSVDDYGCDLPDGSREINIDFACEQRHTLNP